MTFKQLQDAVIGLRFNDGDRDSVKFWINQSYTKIWNHANWSFKTTSSDIAVASGDNSPAMPADFGKALELYNADGARLIYLSRRDFEELFLPDTDTQGNASYYTVIDRQIYLSNAAGSELTYQLSYRRRVSHVDPVSGIIGGVLISDGDQPIWPAEHDYVLVLEATMLGQQLNNDPTWQDLKPARDEALESMKDDLATGEVFKPVTFWGG